MKRGGGLRRTGIKRGTIRMKRGSTLKRGAWRRTKGVMELAAAARWRVLPTEVCTACGKGARSYDELQAHHVISRARLASWCDTQVAELGLGAEEEDELRARVVWDTRGRMVLHASRHDGHTRGSNPLPYLLVPPAVWAMAEELDGLRARGGSMVVWLGRRYPAEGVRHGCRAR